MHTESNPAARPTTYVLAFPLGDDAHIAANDLEQLGFRAVVTWLDDGSWELDAGALTTSDTEAAALARVQRVADSHRGRVDRAHGGWAPARLEMVAPTIAPVPGERAELDWLWTHLHEAAANSDPSPFTTLCADWAAELERRFNFEPPVDDDGWITLQAEAR